MLFLNLISSPWQLIIFTAVILGAITIHEFAHAYTANRLGDPTPKMTGRLTLNPLAHLDFLGTLFLFIVGFGWGKPVLIDPRHFPNPKLDQLTVSLAGPMSNFLLAVLLGLIVRFAPMPSAIQEILFIAVFFNLILMIFNLLPIPPLDGSKFLALFVSEEIYFTLQQAGIYLLLALIFLSSFIPVIPFVISRVVGFFFAIIVGQPITI